MDRSTSVGNSSRRRAGGAGRFPALAAIVLLGALTTACGEDPPVPVEGSVSGTVTLEGAPLADIHVDLEGAGVDQHVDTDASGAYTIPRVIEGTYTVSIEGMPSDTEFEASQTVTISPSSPNATADFAGDYIRTASVSGTVLVEDMPLGGIMVAMTGTESQTATTGADGSFSFGNMRMGEYTVEMSGWDPDRYVFEGTSQSFPVAVGEQKMVEFMGTRREYDFMSRSRTWRCPTRTPPPATSRFPWARRPPGPSCRAACTRSSSRPDRVCTSPSPP